MIDRLTMSQQCVPAARRNGIPNEILGCLGNRRSGRGSCPSTWPWSGMLCSTVNSTVPEGQGAPGDGPVEATKVMRGLEHLSDEKRNGKSWAWSVWRRGD